MDHKKLIAYRNTCNPFAQQLGIVVEDIGPGYARAVKTITAQDLNPTSNVHGGVYFTMADVAAGSASASSGWMAVTLDASYHFLRPAGLGDTLTAQAQEVRGGRTVSVFDVRITDQREVLLGTGTFTFYRIDQPIEL